MSDIERQQFLQESWDTYPSISDKQRAELLLFQKQLLWGSEHRKILACGRLLSMSHLHSFIEIEYQQKNYFIHFDKEILLGRKYSSLFSVLSVGDQVLLYLYEVNAKMDENNKQKIYCQNMEVELLVPSFKALKTNLIIIVYKTVLSGSNLCFLFASFLPKDLSSICELQVW